MSIGKNIQFYRKKCGYSQKELATKLNYSTGTIQQYELEKREPKYNIVCEIASVLNVKPYMLYDTEDIQEDASEYNFVTACNWLHDADYQVEPPDIDDGLQQYGISDFEHGTICKLDKVDIINLVEDCRKQAEMDIDELTLKYIKIAINNRK